MSDLKENEMAKTEETAIVKAEDTHHDVGIVGLWFGLNYGSVLTYYALYNVVCSMGYSAIMVNKPETLWEPRYADKNTVANKFIYKYCDNNVTQSYHSSPYYRVLNDTCDTFIVGSDVVWNYPISGVGSGQFFFLDFVEDTKKKIGMACSFGAGYEGPEEARIWSEHFLHKFDYIGVREDEAVAICRDTFHVDADKIMDPVFLCNRQVFHDIAANSSVHEENKYICSYILGPDNPKKRVFLRIAELLGCEYRCLPNPNSPDKFTMLTGLPSIQGASVEDWLKYFENTECYVGDSFHGLCFSIIFGRPFVCIVNNGQSLARFQTLLSLIGLENRIINVDEDDLSPDVITKRLQDILAQKIDYEKVWRIIDEKASLSYNWLKNAISSKKEIKEYDPEAFKIRSYKMKDYYPETVAGVPETLCTGCAACANICPVDAISMEENDEGFRFPVINPEKCIHCKKCINTCPAVTTLLDNNQLPPVYAASSIDRINKESTSGGAFTAAAEAIIAQGGYVCGAVMDYDPLSVHHIVTNTMEGLSRIKTSKYVQSDINLVYREIKELLEAGKTVLFSGTPCQVGGIRAYLGKPYDNLYLMDLFCHDAPSQKILRTYIRELSQRPEIRKGGEPPKPTQIIFRDKERYGWRSSNHIRVKFDNGAEYIGHFKEPNKPVDNFEKIYYTRLAPRKSCAECIFCALPRQGDISIGDFWGIGKIDPSMDNPKGTSILLINNTQGKKLLDLMRPNLAKVKMMPITAPEIKYNRITAGSEVAVSPKRERFMQLLKTHTMAQSVDLVSRDAFDVGLCVNYLAVNFGGALTHYALYHVLEDLGYSTLMIERPKTSPNLHSHLRDYGRIHLAPLYPSYATAPNYPTREVMRERLNKRCNTFMVGSDKLFNYFLYTALDKYTALDWVSDTKKKIAYSASFGRTLGDPQVHEELGYYLQKFDYFSSREDSGVETAKNVYGVKEAEWVLDPVFLCDFRHYQALIDRSQRQLPEKYISAYLLDPTVAKADTVRHFQKKLGIDYAEAFTEYIRSDAYFEPLGELYKGMLKTEERLQSIANCDFFVTDSFHGMCFAIMMRKPFVAIVNEHRGAARFYSIAKLLHLEDRLLTNYAQLNTDLYDKPIDYDAVHEILNNEKVRCMAWLMHALEAPKLAVMSEYDILMNKIKEQDQKIHALKDLLLNMSANLSSVLQDKLDLLDYLESLKFNVKNTIIVIAVKDTPGLALNSFVSSRLQALGLTTDLVGKHGHSYLAVINGGVPIFEKLGVKDEPIIYDRHFGKYEVYATSRVYLNGNEALIRINEKEYSVNSRGLNIVVYDKINFKAIDSVCFDTHEASFKCTRK